MNRITFFIDGFNLYHSLTENRQYHKYKWLNLFKLAENFITKNDKIENIYYFTALATWNLNKTQRHKLYIKALEAQILKLFMENLKEKTRLAGYVIEHIIHLKKNKQMSI